jgi:NitT/TauT family transport system substrate-binding protein
MSRIPGYVTMALGLLMAMGVAAPAQAQDKVVYALTTTNISVGNAPQSSVPLAANFWKDEGLDVDVIGVAGTMLGIQQISTGAVHFATAGPEALLIARQRGLPVVGPYLLSKPIYETVVLESSSARSYKDLKGKVIGVPEVASGSYPYGRSAVKDAGLDPDRDVKWVAVGLGATAANALRQKEIEAWATWDTGVAALENGGFKFVKIDPSWHDQMPGSLIVTHVDLLKKRPDLVARFLRGMAKATVFALANPEATIRNHWRMYPSTKPQDTSAKGFADSLNIYNSRAMRLSKDAMRKWGESVDAEWDRLVQYSSDPLIAKGTGARSAYTNELIAEINKFDEAAVIAAAKASKW